MTPEKFEQELLKVAAIQREAGWSDHSIRLYALEQRETTKGSLECTLMIGAGLACDNTRFGVPNPVTSITRLHEDPLQPDESALMRGIMNEVYADSGFRNLCDDLQDRIERFLNR